MPARKIHYCYVTVPNRAGQGWRMLRGDEVGALLGEYIATKRATKMTSKNNKGTLANSIVSSSILKKIASAHQMDYQETLTGFKWLAKIPGLTFGYEEALGYCVDAQTVNDKDGVSAALLIAQMATELARDGKTLLTALDEIWEKYGFHATEQISVRVDELSKIEKLMGELRETPPLEFAGKVVLAMDDLNKPQDHLPPTDGIRLWLTGDIRVIIRPSGTEAKIKCYLEVVTQGVAAKKEAELILDSLKPEILKLLTLLD